MRRISTYDAKNRLSELLDAVETGETIEILRRGKPAARLVPVPAASTPFSSADEAAQWLRTHRDRVSRGELRAAIDQGRR